MAGRDSQELALVLVLGATASGKSDLALALAEALDGEILNADSRQLYRGLDIGTAKPDPASRARVPHHLFDLIGPEGSFSAADYRLRALTVAREVAGRGRLPIVVGGTGFYLRALAAPPFDGPGRDPVIHRRLQAIAARGGLPRLRRWLERVDPAWAVRIGAGDSQRILRGLDVYLQSGQPLSQHFARPAAAGEGPEVLRIALDWPRDELYRRIDRRVERMVAEGFVDEVRALRARPEFAASNAAKSIGYGALADHLEGRLTLAEAVERIKRDTRRLAKRQLTWFRHEPDVHWIPVAAGRNPLGEALALIRGWLFRISGPAGRLEAAVGANHNDKGMVQR